MNPIHKISTECETQYEKKQFCTACDVIVRNTPSSENIPSVSPNISLSGQVSEHTHRLSDLHLIAIVLQLALTDNTMPCYIVFT